MSTEQSVRGKIIAALKADALLTAIVPAGQIYPSKVPSEPTWPFIRLGVLIGDPLRLDGGDGADISGVVHAFVKGSTSIPDPEATTMTINGHVWRVLDAIESLDLGTLDLSIHAGQRQVIEDGSEADAYHGITAYEAVAS